MTGAMSHSKNAENTRKRWVWRGIGIGCLVVAGCMMLFWWSLFAKRTRDWTSDPLEAALIRGVVLALVLGGAVILGILSSRQRSR